MSGLRIVKLFIVRSVISEFFVNVAECWGVVITSEVVSGYKQIFSDSLLWGSVDTTTETTSTIFDRVKWHIVDQGILLSNNFILRKYFPLEIFLMCEVAWVHLCLPFLFCTVRSWLVCLFILLLSNKVIVLENIKIWN